MLDKRNLRRARTREKLYEAAVELFSTRGFDETTSDDIAKHAQVGRSTLFLHFETKLDFLKEFYSRFVDEVIADARAEWVGNYRDDVETLVRSWGQCSERNAPIVRFLASLALGHGPLAPEEASADEALGAAFRECIRAAEPEKLRPDLNEREHIDLLIAMLTVTSHDWVNTGMKEPLPQLLLRRFDILHSGLERRSV